ncbi:MAG: hypothetical protein MJZ25_00795 [Fibrobacter sp.]|nr:hypothetical protein [Fibrobacter sp.]
MKGLEKFLPALAFLPLLMLVACGDDDTGDSSNKDKEPSADFGYYESVDDLPECTDSLSGDFAKVEEDYYACSEGSWKKVSAFANGVCNVQECDDSMDGKYAYVKYNRKTYQCVAGEWLDHESKSFTEKEYVACYIDAIVSDSADSMEDLPTCDESLENSIAKVSEKLYACSFEKWMELLDEVVAESDLPACEKDGSSVFVLGKMKNYICKDDAWYVDGKALVSKDTTSKDTVPVVTDSTKVRGICMPSVSNAEKNEEVKWRFINMGGTVGTYLWLLDEDSVSTKASPKMSYSKAGVKRARLLVNDGMPSQSDEIVCSSLNVIATPIASCVCSVSKSKTRVVSEEAPDTVSWSIQGCEGGDEFFYKWKNVRGSGAEVSVIAINSGTYSPKVEVRNNDGSLMNVTCPSVSFSGVLSAQCSISKMKDGAWTFSFDDVANGSSSMKFTLVGDNFESEPITYSYYSNNSYVVKSAYPESSSSEVVVPESSSSEEPVVESSSSEEIVVPESSSSEEEIESSSSEETEPESSSSEEEAESSSSEEAEPESSSSEEEIESSSSEEVAVAESSSSEEFEPFDLPVLTPAPLTMDIEDENAKVYSYALLYNSDTLCVAATTSCGPYYESSIPKGGSIRWYSSSMNGFTPKTYSWMFSDGQTSTAEQPRMTFDKSGLIKAKLLVDKGLPTEKLITCSSLNVEKAAIEGCSCGAPALVSRSDDLAVNTVQYKWNIEGCQSAGAEPLSYVWNEFGKDNETSAVGSFAARGTYGPTVYVTNADGRTVDVNCESVKVEDSDNPVEELVDFRSGSLTAGKYELKNCYYSSRNQVQILVRSNTVGCESWFKTSYQSFSNFSSYRCEGYLNGVELPATIMVPQGDTLMIQNCN